MSCDSGTVHLADLAGSFAGSTAAHERVTKEELLSSRNIVPVKSFSDLLGNLKQEVICSLMGNPSEAIANVMNQLQKTTADVI